MFTATRPDRGRRLTRFGGFATTRLRQGLAVPVLVVGVGSGIVGAAYLGALHVTTELLGPGDNWTALAHGLILVAVGVSITVLSRLLGDSGNVELLVDNIHVLGGAEDIRQVRPLIPISLLCVGAGGTMGPEAPLVQTNGAFGTWIAEKFKLDAEGMRVVTITGMSAGFAILFGAPLGAALFALEILHRRGLQYYEALVPALVGALVGFVLNFSLTGLGLDPVWALPDPGQLTGSDLAWGVACGLLGAAGTFVFTWAVHGSRHLVSRVPGAVLPVAAGVLLGLLAWWSPFALTNGEFQVEEVVAGGMATGALGVAIVAKFAGVLVTLTGRWKGGFIIPLYFIGIAGGQLIHLLVPDTNATVLMASLAVALCVGVTKTPLGSTLVVSQMAGLALLPTALTAAVVALVLTSRTVVIETQRARTQLGDLAA